MVGGVRYALAGCFGIDGGGSVGFGSDAWRWPKDGIGLVLGLGAMVGKRLADMAANFDIICRMYVGNHILKLLQSMSNPNIGTSPAPSD